MSRVALSYDIPYVKTVTMPARWLAAQGTFPNPNRSTSWTLTHRQINKSHGLLDAILGPCID